MKFGKMRGLDGAQVAGLELTFGRDINGDSFIGNEILQVLSSGPPAGVGLYDTALDGLTIDAAGLVAGDQTDSPLRLKRLNGQA